MAESELVFKIRNRQTLMDMVNDLRTTVREIHDINPNMHPIQLHTKLRWQENMDKTLEFLEKLLASTEKES